jgi:hypothetical protein
MPLHEDWNRAREPRLKEGLRKAEALLTSMAAAWPPDSPCPFRDMADAVRVARRILTSPTLDRRLAGERATTPAEAKRHGATHVLYLDAREEKP